MTNRKETKEFNDTIMFPVKWQSGRKTQYSSSWNRSIEGEPLVHIQLLENYSKGKMTRMAGSFLCHEGTGSPDFEECHCEHEDAKGKYDAKVTCRICLERAATHRKENA